MKILYIGPWASEQALFCRKAVNQAATTWARGLILALLEQGCTVRVCSHCAEQYWPLGDIRPGGIDDFSKECPLSFSRYWNLPLGRMLSLENSYRKMITRELADCRPDIVLLYNMESYHCSITEILTEQGISWLPLILDEDEVGITGWNGFCQKVKNADGLVFLSYWGFINCPADIPKLHLDGGVSYFPADALPKNIFPCREKTVVYSGVYDERYGGLDKLFEIFAAVTCTCRFVLTGKDVKGNLKKYLKKEARAEYIGFVDQDTLCSVHENATVFINPRTTCISENRMTFPSKLLKYLSYGKPVVSTWTEGLSPEYRELLLFPENDVPEAYASLLDNALNYTLEERIQLQERIRNWAVKHTWEIQAVRLMKWFREDVGITGCSVES